MPLRIKTKSPETDRQHHRIAERKKKALEQMFQETQKKFDDAYISILALAALCTTSLGTTKGYNGRNS